MEGGRLGTLAKRMTKQPEQVSETSMLRLTLEGGDMLSCTAPTLQSPAGKEAGPKCPNTTLGPSWMQGNRRPYT